MFVLKRRTEICLSGRDGLTNVCPEETDLQMFVVKKQTDKCLSQRDGLTYVCLEEARRWKTTKRGKEKSGES